MFGYVYLCGVKIVTPCIRSHCNHIEEFQSDLYTKALGDASVRLVHTWKQQKFKISVEIIGTAS